MIVFDLQCSVRHVFEGWFAGEADFQQQCQQGLLVCPLCGDPQVSKRLSAPRLNLASQAQALVPACAAAEARGNDIDSVLQQAWLETARRIVADTEDVGADFSREARRIHYGEAPERGIRGYATPAQTASLIDEGISVVPLAMPESMKKTLQ